MIGAGKGTSGDVVCGSTSDTSAGKNPNSRATCSDVTFEPT